MKLDKKFISKTDKSSILKYVFKLLGFYFIDSWEYSFESESKNNHKLIKNNLYKFNKKFIYLNLNNFHISGWYFLGICHLGDNNNLIGYVESNNSSLRQGRKIPSTRIRWRIVYLPKKVNLKILLNNIDYPIIFKNIYFFKIPFWFAKRKIIRKINNNTPLLVSDTTSFCRYWKIYNKFFDPNPIRGNLINYQAWIEIYENEFKKELYLKRINQTNYAFNEKENLLVTNQKKFFILKSSDIRLSEIAVNAIIWGIDSSPKTLLFYGDEDSLNQNGERCSPSFKPSWNKELFFSNPNYSSIWIIDFSLYSQFINLFIQKDIVNKKEKLINIVSYLISEKRENLISHIPLILGHKVFKKDDQKNEIENLESYRANILKTFKNIYPRGFSISTNKKLSSLEYKYEMPKDILISILIPIRDKVELLRTCINSIIETELECYLEIIIIDNNSIEKSTHDFLNNLKEVSSKKINFKIISYPGEFNYSAINNHAFKYVNGEVIILLNNDLKILTKNWASLIASYALREEIGCVGVKLVYPDYKIQHAGIILGIYGSAGYSHKNFGRNDSGHSNRLNYSQNISAVTGAFLAVERKVWIELKGLDENNFPVNYNDVDFCLRANELGLKNIYLPQIEAIHFESKSRGKPIGREFKRWKKEYKFFKKKWNHIIIEDPNYNPSLTRIKEDWSLNLAKPNFNLR